MFDRIVSIGSCLFIAVWAIVQSLYNIVEINASSNWIPIEASVDSIGASGADDSFNALIYYQYEIEDKTYNGHTMTLGTGGSYKTRGWALQAAQEYLGEENSDVINIYYNPDDRKNSTILRAEITDEMPVLAIGLVSLLIAYRLHLWYKK